MHSIFFLAITYNSFARSSLNNPKFFINNLVDEFNTYISLSLFSFYYLLFLPLTLTLWYFLVWCMNPHILNFRLLTYLGIHNIVSLPARIFISAYSDLVSFLFRHYYSASYLLLRITTRLRVKKRQQKIRNLYEMHKNWNYNSNLSFCFFLTQLPWNREPACREARKTSIAEARDILAVFLVSPFSILFDCESIYLYLWEFSIVRFRPGNT